MMPKKWDFLMVQDLFSSLFTELENASNSKRKEYDQYKDAKHERI